MTEKQYKNGEVIFRELEDGNCFYQILEGTVGIYLHYGEPDELKLTELTKEQYFGEMAVLESYPRSATAVALSDDTRVQEILSNEVIEYLGNQPDNTLKVMKHLASRLRDLTKDYNDVSLLISELKPAEKEKRSEGFLQKMKKYIAAYKNNSRAADAHSVESLRKLEGPEHSSGFAKNIEKYREDTLICKEGEMGDCMYDIHWGSVGIFTGYGTDKERKLATLMPNNFFGELGMVGNEPRSATVVALENDTTVEIIYPQDLEELFKKNPPKVGMILRHLSYRLRVLTQRYTEACKLVYEVSEQESGNGKISDELLAKVKEYKARLYD